MGNILGLVLVEFTLVVSVSVWFLCFLDDTNMSGGGMNQWYMKKNHIFVQSGKDKDIRSKDLENLVLIKLVFK